MSFGESTFSLSNERSAVTPTFFELYDYPKSDVHKAEFAQMEAQLTAHLPENDREMFAVCADLLAWRFWPTNRPPLGLEMEPHTDYPRNTQIEVNRAVSKSMDGVLTLFRSKGLDGLWHHINDGRKLSREKIDAHLRRRIAAEVPFQYILSLGADDKQAQERPLDIIQRSIRRNEIYAAIPGADHELPPDIALLRSRKEAALELEEAVARVRRPSSVADTKLRQIIAAHSDNMPELAAELATIKPQDHVESAEISNVSNSLEKTANSLASVLLPAGALAPYSLYSMAFAELLTYMYTQTHIPYKQRGQKAIDYAVKWMNDELCEDTSVESWSYQRCCWLGSIAALPQIPDRLRNKTSLSGQSHSPVPPTASNVTCQFNKNTGGNTLAVVNRFEDSTTPRILQFMPGSSGGNARTIPKDDVDLRMTLLSYKRESTPYVAGYELVNPDYYDLSFTKSAEDPYRRDPLVLEEYRQVAAAKVFRDIGLSALANEIMDHTDLTFDELVSAQRRYSLYQEYHPELARYIYVPPSLEECVENDTFFTQCTGAFALLKHVTAAAFPEAKVAAAQGYLIRLEGQIITTIGHVQLDMLLSDRSYRFDATPSRITHASSREDVVAVSGRFSSLLPMTNRSRSVPVNPDVKHDVFPLVYEPQEMPKRVRTFQEELDDARKCLKAIMQAAVPLEGSGAPDRDALITAAAKLDTDDPLHRSVAALFIDARTQDNEYLKHTAVYLAHVSEADQQLLRKVRLGRYQQLQPLLKALAESLTRLAGTNKN